MQKQMSFFDGTQNFVIDKPIRFIAFFAGYGSQELALKYLGVPFEYWKISEWAIKSIQAYKDMHFHEDNTDYSQGKTTADLRRWLLGKISSDYSTPCTETYIKRLNENTVRKIYNNMQATHNLGSITEIHGSDLEIVDADKYIYIASYSFPCQDLSTSGKGAGMKKGSGTRSGLLWELERILLELSGGGYSLPQVLLMENVPQVIGKKFSQDFAKWLAFLEGLGYKCYWKVINAKDYTIPQNRERCFMVSIMGDYDYVFPEGFTLEKRLKDLLESNVAEKYYLSDKTVDMFIKNNEKQAAKGNGFKFDPTTGGGYAKCILTRAGSRPDDNFIIEANIKKHNQVGGGDNKCSTQHQTDNRANGGISNEMRNKVRKGNGLRINDNGARFQRPRQSSDNCGCGTVCERCDGVILGQSPNYNGCRPMHDLSKTILTTGMNGVIEWYTTKK